MLKLYKVTAIIQVNGEEPMDDEIHMFAKSAKNAENIVKNQEYSDGEGSYTVTGSEYLRDIREDEKALGYIEEGTGQNAINGISEFWP